MDFQVIIAYRSLYATRKSEDRNFDEVGGHRKRGKSESLINFWIRADSFQYRK